MFHIALCDNDPTQCIQFSKCIHQLPQAAEPIALHSYTKGATLLREYQQGARFNLIILGSARDNRQLLVLARSLRRFDSKVPIMVLSQTSRYSLEGYEIPLYRYYKEPFPALTFQRDLQELLDRNLFTQSQPFLFSNWQGLHRITLNEILYFKSEGYRILVATEKESFIYRESIHVLENRLERFLFHRIHRSYLVNLRWVRNVWGRELTLRTGKVLPLATHRSRELRQRLIALSNQLPN